MPIEEGAGCLLELLLNAVVEGVSLLLDIVIVLVELVICFWPFGDSSARRERVRSRREARKQRRRERRERRKRG
jgi:hypothetical protein